MRIYIQTTANTEMVPYDYQPALVGAFHKWAGNNEVHDELSLYSISWLSHAKPQKGGLNFPRGGLFFISSPSIELVKRIVSGIQQSPSIRYGMSVSGIFLKTPPDFGNKQRFLVQSPVLIKRSIGPNIRFYYPEDQQADDYLTQTLKNKLKKAGKGDLQVRVGFDRSYPNIRRKVSTYKGIKNKGTVCPVIIEGDPEALAFAWEVGVGNSTGIGFGALQ